MTNAEAEQSPLAQAEEMKARLDRAGVPAYLRVLPGSEHALNGSNALNALPYTVVFFDRYLKSAPIPGAIGSERGRADASAATVRRGVPLAGGWRRDRRRGDARVREAARRADPIDRTVSG